MNIEPITTMAQLDALDQDAIVAGYLAGFGSVAVNHMRTDAAYWHGYRNGQVDRGVEPISPEQADLARQYVAREWAN